jgi:hypothetical protein
MKMETIQVTQSDIDNLAAKLDEFSSVLNDRERLLLVAMFGFAQTAIEAAAAPTRPKPGGAQPKLPPLSAGFRDAFKAGVGAKFDIETDASETERIKVKAKGSIEN